MATPSRWRASSRSRRRPLRARPRRRGPAPVTTTRRRSPPRRWTAGPSAERPGRARSAWRPAGAGHSPRRPIPVLPAGAALGGAPALVLAGELGVAAPTAALRKVAALLPYGTFVRVRGAAALPALSDPEGCAGDARAHVPADARAREPRLRPAAGARRRRRVLPAHALGRHSRPARRRRARTRPLDARRPARRDRRGARRGRCAGGRRGARRAGASCRDCAADRRS